MAYKNFKKTEIIEEIGAELRKIRVSKKLTIRNVANELSHTGLHISTTLLGRIENGERRIDDESLNTICYFYNVNPDDVIISASKEHIRRLSNNHLDVIYNFQADIILDLYQNLNAEGQQEVASLMRLMAYMDAYKKSRNP